MRGGLRTLSCVNRAFSSGPESTGPKAHSTFRGSQRYLLISKIRRKTSRSLKI